MGPRGALPQGWHEKDDVACVLDHLRASGLVTAIALWGRSMGSVSAVLQASRDPSIAGLVLDSPFASLEQVALELVTTAPDTVPGAPHVPPFLVKTALNVVASSVKSRAGFDLFKLRPVDAAKTCFVPSLFGAGDSDVLVRPHHSQQIFDAYVGDKNLVRFEGDHNDVRPGFFNDSACIFLKQVLLIPEELAIEAPTGRDNRPLNIAHSFGGARGGRLDPAEAQRLALAHRTAMAQEEEALLMQAILASLESTAASAPQTLPASDAPAAPAPPQLGSLPPFPAVADPAAADDDDDDDDPMLREAIRLSLENARAAAAEAPPAGAPGAEAAAGGAAPPASATPAADLS